MSEITTLAIDLAMQVFQLHGVDDRGVALRQQQVRRAQLTSTLAQLPVCTVAMEACGSAHHWGRVAQRLGHRVHLIPPQYVKAYARGQKNDRNDAQAIAEAARVPGMAQVAVKSEEQQAILALHRFREQLVKERTALANQLQGVLREFGLLVPRAPLQMRARLADLLASEAIPAVLRPAVRSHCDHLTEIEARLRALTHQLQQVARDSEPCQRLMRRRGVGPIIATAFVAEVANPTAFKNGRQVAAWLGLVPRQHSSGSITRLLGVTKRGNPYLRQLLVHGARSALLAAHRHPEDPLCRWSLQLRVRRGHNRATVALANKLARHLWASLRYEVA